MPPYLRMFLVFRTLGLLAFVAEYLFPAREVQYRSVFLRDLVALGVYNLCFLLVVPLTDRIPIPNYAPAGLLKLPLAYKLLLFYIVEDFGLYWVHRLMRNNRMHMNVSWKSTWLEYLIVTPRYHHVHHSDNPVHYRSNLGSLLTIWDRVFGTYFDPGKVSQTLRLSARELRRCAWLLVYSPP